jgi:RNA polymerase sigma-70 factor, ECF subfamily
MKIDSHVVSWQKLHGFMQRRSGTAGTLSCSPASSKKEGRVQYQEFATLAASYLTELYNAARRMTGESQEAEDLVQETYARALQTWRQLNDPARCRAWLYRIMRNLFVDTYRRRRARPELAVDESDSAMDNESLSEWLANPEPDVFRRLSAAELRQALTVLPEELRTALVLCDVEGFTYPEIAEVMECPIGTIRSRIARARQKLLTKLREQTEAPTLGREEKK